MQYSEIGGEHYFGFCGGFGYLVRMSPLAFRIDGGVQIESLSYDVAYYNPDIEWVDPIRVIDKGGALTNAGGRGKQLGVYGAFTVNTTWIPLPLNMFFSLDLSNQRLFEVQGTTRPALFSASHRGSISVSRRTVG